jgi:hypothetical protein
MITGTFAIRTSPGDGLCPRPISPTASPRSQAPGVLIIGMTLAMMASLSHAQPTSPGNGALDRPKAVSNAPFTASDVVRPRGLPAIGKWMIDHNGAVAHWLGEIYQGKHLHEPINVILIDAGAASAAHARERLLQATAAAGYPIRFGHSAGYHGYIAGELYTQLPAGRDDAFSNRIFELSNNHGRIFGPHPMRGAYVFIGAFSREAVDLLRWPVHRYASFNQARDDFARALDLQTPFKSAGFVALENAIVGDPDVTTGDHDGRAVLLRAGGR